MRQGCVSLPFRKTLVALGLLIAVGSVSIEVLADEPNLIFAELIGKGVDTGNGMPVKLPVPTMADGLTVAEQRKALNSITDANKTLAQILAKGVNSPFKQTTTPAAGNKTAFHVDLWYVAYGSLQTVQAKNFLQGLRPAPATPAKAANDPQKLPSKSIDLTDEHLKAREIVLPPKEQLDERYAYGLFELLDKAYLGITTRAVHSTQKESILVAGYVDPRFLSDKEFPNQWQPITRNSVGLPVLGKPQPYRGAGGYLKVTELKEPVGALFIEAHLVYNEPLGWFNGAGLLRAKIGTLARENVTMFRQKLRKAEEEKTK